MKRAFYSAFILLVLCRAVLAEGPLDENPAGLNDSQDINASEGALNSSALSVEGIIPEKFRPGDIQFNILVLNNGTEEQKNIYPIITGSGFSTVGMVPIDSLKPGGKSYVIVMGRAESAGVLNLSIFLDGLTFYREVLVEGEGGQGGSGASADEQEKKALEELSAGLEELDAGYKQLEEGIIAKRNAGYDVEGISVDDLKKFLRNARSSILREDSAQAKIDIALASNEYNDLKSRIDSALLVKKPWSSLIKDNAVLISTIVGALLASFSLFEILKKKKESFSLRIREVKAEKDGKEKSG